MPKETVVTYERVAEVAEGFLLRGENPTVEKVQEITGGRTDYIRRDLKIWRNRKMEERKALIASAIDEKLAKAILENQEKFACARDALLREEIEDLKGDCASMDKELAELYTERDELASVLSNERENCQQEIKDLEHGNSALVEELSSSLVRVDLLLKERDAAVGNLEIANKGLQGLRESLGKAKSEVKTEREGATKLLAQLETANIALADTQTKLDSAVREGDQLGGVVTGLTSQVQQLREDLAKENELRIEAMTAFATANSRADTLQAALDALNKSKPLAKAKASVSTAASATK